MSARLSRKRSRLAPDSDDDEAQQLRPPSPALSSLSDTLKRSKTQCELDELDIIEPKDAWTVDVGAILASTTLAAPSGSGLKPHNNWQRYQKDQSIIVLCVQGNLQLHYNLLCSALDDLYAVAPSLQALVLCHNPFAHKPSTTATFSLPLISAVDPPNNHFVRLGLLHPLGGGQFPLDALAVVDKRGRRRYAGRPKYTKQIDDAAEALHRDIRERVLNVVRSFQKQVAAATIEHASYTL